MRFFTSIFDLVQKYSLVTKVTNFAKGSQIIISLRKESHLFLQSVGNYKRVNK